MSEPRARVIAFYLPQFHPVPENDGWWGKGFTEWTNVAKAKPAFKGHYQPRVPADLGFYDLRLAESREAQAKMAADYGIEGFCYWHYWFGNGKKILERPIYEVLKTGEPKFPFCLAWANGSWSGIWHGEPKRILIEQTYPGEQDYINYFHDLLGAFLDERYIKVDGKPLFCINEPELIPDIVNFTNLFRKLALENGLEGMYIVANTGDINWDPAKHGCDAVNLVLMGNLYRGLPSGKKFFLRKVKNQIIKWPLLSKMYKKLLKRPLQVFEYKDVIPYLVSHKKQTYDCYPCVVPNWDNFPRSGINSMVFNNSTPQLFEKHLAEAVNLVQDNIESKKIVFVKAWNEWAEGNHLEPDHKFGLQYLEAVRKVILGR